MTSFLAVFAIAFVAILLVELPDKTLVATLVLSTKYRRRPVLVGVAAAFAIQCIIAVTAGGLLHLLNKRVVEAVVAALFAVGSVLLIRESIGGEDDADGDGPDDASVGELVSTRRITAISFGVLFAAEWGDASQLATAGLVAKYGNPIAIGLGAFIALVAVAVLAASIGKAVLRVVPLQLVHRVAAGLFAVFAVIALIAAIRG